MGYIGFQPKFSVTSLQVSQLYILTKMKSQVENSAKQKGDLQIETNNATGTDI